MLKNIILVLKLPTQWTFSSIYSLLPVSLSQTTGESYFKNENVDIANGTIIWETSCRINHCPSVLWHCWVIWLVKSYPIWPICCWVGCWTYYTILYTMSSQSVQQSVCRWISCKPGHRLSFLQQARSYLFSCRTSPLILYCLVTEVRVWITCICYMAVVLLWVEPVTSWSPVLCSDRCHIAWLTLSSAET